MEEGRRRTAAVGSGVTARYVAGPLETAVGGLTESGARTDERAEFAAAAVSHGIPCITTLQAADAAVLAMEALRQEEITVQAVQDRFPVKR